LSELVNELTIEEKVMLVFGQGMWRTRAIPRPGIPSLLMVDGAHGARYPFPRSMTTSSQVKILPPFWTLSAEVRT
jgi:beta-glucosidase